jgi:microcystin-dependent protein
MSCSNCFNGCAEIVSDQCVRYTGIDIPVLGIKSGDSLSYVEQALITFLTSTLDGSGIKPTIDPTIICNLVKQYLPTCEDLTVTNILTALIKAACDLQTQTFTNLTSINTINGQIATIEANYNLTCDYITDVTPSVTPSSGTHAVLQATIDALCAFILDVEAHYVLLVDLPGLIQDYLNTLYPPTQQYTKMIPYVAVPYFGSVANFDSTGAGFANLGYDKIYLCNGNNSTPDLRGRVLVGAIQGMYGGPLAPAVDPNFSFYNPNYAVNDISGTNSIILNTPQLPAHTHGIVDPGHAHTYLKAGTVGVTESLTQGITSGATGITSTATTNISVTSAGGGQPHQNNQPSWACYYIIYIP